jgi:hypothetical protein
LYINNFNAIILVFCCTNGTLDFVSPISVCCWHFPLLDKSWLAFLNPFFYLSSDPLDKTTMFLSSRSAKFSIIYSLGANYWSNDVTRLLLLSVKFNSLSLIRDMNLDGYAPLNVFKLDSYAVESLRHNHSTWKTVDCLRHNHSTWMVMRRWMSSTWIVMPLKVFGITIPLGRQLTVFGITIQLGWLCRWMSST